jgi:UDP-N-acetylglucosamine 4-epimerase
MGIMGTIPKTWLVTGVAGFIGSNLLELFTLLRDGLAARHPHLKDAQPIHRDFRAGDVLHSQADIGKARRLLGYEPTYSIGQGLAEALGWYEGLRS